MGRAPCCSKVGLHKGPWTPKEDALLIQYIQSHGEGHWRSLPLNAGLLRCGKSCRLRWMNYLRPDIKRGNITPEEEDLIVKLHGLLGNRWSVIAKSLPGRTDNEIKNYWNTHLNKRLHNQRTIDVEKSSNGKKRSNHSNQSKILNPNSLVDDKLGVFKEIKDENTIKIGEENEITKIHLPKPVRASPMMMSSLARNNNIMSLVEANYNYLSPNYSSGSSANQSQSQGQRQRQSQSQSQNPNDEHIELPFDSSQNGILDMPWLSSNTNNMGDDHHMMMMGSSSCGDNDVNVDHIIHQHHHDHHYGVAPQDGNNIQPFENLYEEYLQLIKVDQYHGIDDGGDDHDDVDSFTRSFLI